MSKNLNLQIISKSERILLAGSYGLLLLNCGLLLSLIRDYNYKEKEPNFNFPIIVVARGKQIMMDIWTSETVMQSKSVKHLKISVSLLSLSWNVVARATKCKQILAMMDIWSYEKLCNQNG